MSVLKLGKHLLMKVLMLFGEHLTPLREAIFRRAYCPDLKMTNI